MLPNPYLPQMLNDGIITDNELTLNKDSIVIQIHRYETATEGDYIACFFNGGPLETKVIVDVSTDFPVQFFCGTSSLPDGIYPVYYTVTESGSGNPAASPTAYAFLYRSGGYPFPPPVFPDAINGFLPQTGYVTNVHVTVDYPTMKLADNFAVTLSAIDNGGMQIGEETVTHEVSSADIDNHHQGIPLSFLFSNSLPLQMNQKGMLVASYSGKLAGIDDQTSPPSTVHLDSSPPILPPPIFTQASNGVLNIEQVTVAGNTPLVANYLLNANDEVTFVVSGKNADGIPIPGADWQKTLSITQAVSSVQVNVPAAILLAVGELGTLTAKYVLKSSGVYSQSENTEVMMKSDALNALYGLQVTSGAPVRMHPPVTLPCNRGVVYAPGGTTVRVGANQAILAHDDARRHPLRTNELELTTDTSGRAYFTAYSNTNVIDTVHVDFQTTGIPSAQADMEFRPYLVGNGALAFYRYTNFAPADGKTRNAIYIQTDQSITLILVKLLNAPTAQLVGGVEGLYALNEDGSATIEVINTAATGTTPVTVQLMLNANQSLVTITDMQFVTPFNQQ